MDKRKRRAAMMMMGGGAIRYLMRDHMTAAGATADDGVSTRTPTDTENKISYANSLMTMAPKAAPAWGDPGIWYPGVSRAAGRVLVATITPNNNNEQVGFDGAGVAGLLDIAAFWFTGGTIKAYSGASSENVAVGAYTAGQTYRIALVLRGVGAMYYIQGGTEYPKFTFLWPSKLNNTATVYPAIVNNDGTFTVDLIDVPLLTTLFNPVPILSDGFGGTFGTTDGLGHAETSGWGAGGSGQTLTGAGYANAAGKAANTPTTSAEILTDGGLEANYTAGKCDSLTKGGSPTLVESADAHGGTKAQQFTGTAQYNQVYFPNVLNPPAGTWYKLKAWGKRTAGTNGGASVLLTQNGVGSIALPITSAAYAEYIVCRRSQAGVNNWFTAAPAWESRTSGFDTVVIDDCSLVSMATPALMASTQQLSTSEVMIDIDVLAPSGVQGGLYFNIDDPANPTNYVHVWVDKYSGKVWVDKMAGGTFAPVSNTSITYADNGTLRVVKSGSTYKVYYQGALITTQTISDATIINNKYFAAFSNDASVKLDNLVIRPLGAGGEYTSLERFFSDGGSAVARPTLSIMPMGDSKSSLANYAALVNDMTGDNVICVEAPARIATGGWTLADLLGALPAALAARGALSYAILNVGANDVDMLDWGDPSTATTWETNYLAVIDALVAKTAAVKIVLVKPWRTDHDEDAACTALWGIVEAAATAKAANVIRVICEKDYLTPAATYMAVDGIHPNDAGNLRMSAAYRAAAGY